MTYKEDDEILIIDSEHIDDDVQQCIKSISSLIGFDFSQFNITNIYSLNVVLNSPERFINNPDVCIKLRDLKELIHLLGGRENVPK